MENNNGRVVILILMSFFFYKNLHNQEKIASLHQQLSLHRRKHLDHFVLLLSVSALLSLYITSETSNRQ